MNISEYRAGLEARGMSPELADFVSHAGENLGGGIVTNQTLTDRLDVMSAQFKTELANLRTDLSGETKDLNTSLSGQIKDLRTEMVRTVYLSQAATISILGGLIVILRFFVT